MVKILKISSLGCMSCILMEERFKNISKKNKWEVIDLNADLDDLGEYSKYNEYPCFIVLDKKGKYLNHFVGEFKEKELEDLILQCIYE